MQITLDIPEELAAQLIPDGMSPSRAALEAFAVEGYRTHRLSESEVRQMLGYETRMEAHAFLKQHEAYLHYTLADLDRDIETSRLLHANYPRATESPDRIAG